MALLLNKKINTLIDNLQSYKGQRSVLSKQDVIIDHSEVGRITIDYRHTVMRTKQKLKSIDLPIMKY